MGKKSNDSSSTGTGSEEEFPLEISAEEFDDLVTQVGELSEAEAKEEWLEILCLERFRWFWVVDQQ